MPDQRPVPMHSKNHATGRPRRRFRRVLWLVPLLAICAAAIPLREDYFELSKQLEIMTSLFRELNIYYVDELQPGHLMETGIDAMVHSLDPYTIYYPESRVEDLRFMTTGEYGGIGASIQFTNNEHAIVGVLPDFPASRGGLRIGDVLLAVDGQSLVDIDEALVPEMLQGASGTIVEIEFLRFGESESQKLTLKREKIKLPAVPYRGVIGDSTGYIILAAFTRGSAHEARQAIRFLKDSVGINQLVLDLRGNGGGLLQESISLVNLFVDKGLEVVSTKGKNPEWDKSYTTLAEPLIPDLPVAILIDEQSASASEIVAGTLQDFDRAIVVGNESFGKGLVQQTKQLAYGTKVKVTVAKYYTASGRCIQRLDYGGERSEDGTAVAVADSLIHFFKTQNGRPVVDGKGIQPDVQVESPYISYVLEGLYVQGILFDYVNYWCAGRDSIAEPDEYAWQDEDWEDFVRFVKTKEDVTYESQSHLIWDGLLEAARIEQFMDADSTVFGQMAALFAPQIERDLNRFRPEIETALEEETVMRYYLQDGVTEWMIPRDSVLHKAIELMSSGEAANILSGAIAP